MPETIESVLAVERTVVKQRREKAFGEQPTDEELDQTLFGMCFSGGGIRSATFHLGVLQGLARLNILKQVDYLSTVSGGGYIGSWFHGLVKRTPFLREVNSSGNPLFEDYQAYLADQEKATEDSSTDPITFLRKYSNYLSPQLGFLSTDTWVMGTVWLRNTALNQLILYLFLGATLLIPILIGNSSRILENWARDSKAVTIAEGLAIFALLTWIVNRIARNVRPVVAHEFQRPVMNRAPDDDSSAWFKIVLPLWINALLVAHLMATGHLDPLNPKAALIMYAALLVLFWRMLRHGGFEICYEQRHGTQQTWKRRRLLLAITIVTVCSFVTFVLLALDRYLLLFLRISSQGQLLHAGTWHSVTWGPFLTLLCLVGGVVLQVGLMGVDFPDSAREWYSRLAAKLLICSVVWMGWFIFSVFTPLLIFWMFGNWQGLATAVAGWFTATAVGVLTGKSPLTIGKADNKEAPEPTKKKSALEALAAYAPAVALVGVLVAVSTLACLCVAGVQRLFSTTFARDSAWSLTAAETAWLALAIGLLLGVALAISTRININEFSLNHFYKNRLVRCYLGASNVALRDPNHFTGFDPKDDIPLADLLPSKQYDGPFAIINTTLNLNHGSELAWQERKSSSFVFTPAYCGYVPRHGDRGFVPTRDFVQPGGPHLGLAAAISGAAANPNWGYHTQPTTAFLLTLFNVRLGWWIGNTRIPAMAKTPGPMIAFKYLLAELLGLTNEESNYLNLSDGGHFENLGLYELVRRKCRFIIAGDAEEDPDYQFESLGGAIRKIRIDFGASIDISPKRIFLENGVSQVHCALGTICYQDGSTGTLLYLKSSLTGDEPYDVSQYRKADPAFPQNTTLDQFFSESTFESYRRLGEHIVHHVFHRVQKPQTPSDLPRMFARLQDNWLPPTTAANGAFSKHASTYSALLSRLAGDETLRFLDCEIIPGISGGTRPAANSPEMRRARLLVADFIQLMELVYLDLNLEEDGQLKHPSNAGWIKLFNHWVQGDTFLEVWCLAGGVYGSGFRRFFERLQAAARGVVIDPEC
jgi:hypothetical protein